MSASDDASSATFESLMQFLYRAPIGLVQTTRAGEVEMINPTAARLLMPLAPDGALDNLFHALRDVAPALSLRVEAAGPEDDVVCEGLRLTPAGKGQVTVLSLSLMRLGESRLMAVLDDVSQQVRQEQRQLERRLHDAAHTDVLTQLPNRAALLAQLSEVLAQRLGQPAPFALLFLNCDRFKRVNDRLGPAVGDGLLGMFAARLATTLRAGDATVARVGGDEFAVLLHPLDRQEEALVVSQRLVDQLARPCQVDGHALSCSVSGGLVSGDGGQADADAVLRDASIAMVEAKRQGGSRFVVFEPAMRERALQRSRVEADLRLALAEQQLFVVYQPIVPLQRPDHERRCEGLEALVRWRHPQRGTVPPLEFIGVAEECGLISAIGEFVLGQAARQLRSWQLSLGDAAPRWVAVNLSRAQLQHADFVATVQAVLAGSGLAPGCLQLEVTESLAAHDSTVQATLHRLKALGVTLALDDFGTGYSSLSSLHQFPVDVVKIDRSFTAQVDTSPHHRVLVEATVMVARSLGMSTVVEGVETAAQAQIVQDLGCHKGQGYLYARPLSADDLAAWLQPPLAALPAP